MQNNNDKGGSVKLCFIAPGNSPHSYRWVTYFANMGFQVHWISLHPLTWGTVDNFRFYEVRRSFLPGLSLLSMAIRVKRSLRKINPDLVHVHSVGIYGFISSMCVGHPLIATAWGSDVLSAKKSIIRKMLVKLFLSKADLITCDAEHMVDAMVGLGVEETKIKRINFGVDTNKFCHGQKSLRLRQLLDIENSPTVISLRSLHPVYDIESLIRAVPYVLKEKSETKFIIVGTGPEEKNLKSLAESLGVSANIRFLGRIENEELNEYLNAMDVYVSTSLSDAGISACTAEAMACELPVVITDSGENHKWVGNDDAGFLVPVKDPEKLSEKIIRLLKDEQLRMRLGHAARKVIKQNNDYCTEMEKMERIYRSYAGNR